MHAAISSEAFKRSMAFACQVLRLPLAGAGAAPLRKLADDPTHVMVHVPQADRARLIEEIAQAQAMRWGLTIEMIEQPSEQPRWSRGEQGTLQIRDTLGGSATLRMIISWRLHPRRYVMSGGEAEACLHQQVRDILAQNASCGRLPVEFYLAVEAIFSLRGSGDGDGGLGSLTRTLAGFQADAERHGYSAGLWADDELLTRTTEEPHVRFLTYSSISRMLSSL